MVRDEAVGSAHHGRLGILMERAIRLPADRRRAFLGAACGEDRALHDELVSLLAAHDAASGFFEALSGDVIEPALHAMGLRSGSKTEPDLVGTLREKLAGAYRIERELEGGGMSRVFVAEDIGLKRPVVIKVLPPEMTPAAGRDRFRREIELAAKLQHPHIVPVLTADSAAGLLYYTMPLVTGVPLSDRLAREGALPFPAALEIWRDILDALAYAHANGVVHRDIKPGNILLSGRHALVIDFGIARAIEAAGVASAVTPLIGTPAYLAPEETSADAEPDHRVDIYSAGLVMYEMLAGVPPFAANSAREYASSHRSHRPPPLRGTGAPVKLIDLVMGCLAKDPTGRPETAEALLAELAGVTTRTPPTGGTGRLRRRLAPYAIASLVLAALGLATVRGVSEDRRNNPYTPDIAASEWYRRAWDLSLMRTDSGLRQRVEYFKRAVALDSMYVDAWAGLSSSYARLANAAPRPQKDEWLHLARQAAVTARALDERDADARAALGWVHVVSRDFPAAVTELELAVSLDPDVPRGHEGLARAYMMTGRPRQQLEHARLAVASDPSSYSAVRELALALATNGRCEESLEPLQSLKDLTPPASVAGVLRGLCFASREMWTEAVAEFEWAGHLGANAAPALLGHALAREGRLDEATDLLSDLLTERTYSQGAFGIAAIYAGMGDYDQAFAWLDRAIEDGTMSFYIVHPAFEDLHRDVRFERIREGLGAQKR